jgi:DNA-binding GntR family transcriptional regulator
MDVGSTKLGDRSLKNDVCAEIVQMLHRGELKPGDRISESEIAVRLGISRSPVREAFAQLEHEGVIVRKPRSGSFINRRSDQELIDLQETRILIESYAARVVCDEFSRDHHDELARIIEAMAETEGTPNWIEGSRLNAQFHQTVVRMTANQALQKLWKTLDPLAWLLAPWAIPPDPAVSPNLVSRHQLLLDALASGMPDLAADAFSDHIFNATLITAERYRRPGHARLASERAMRR